jgi:3-phosphoshikimate 1-carboxyvinyltransferase
MSRFEPSGPLRGELRPPPDKSISHRAAIIAAMAGGETAITAYLDSADTRSTLRAVAAAGASVEETDSSDGRLSLRIRGAGLRAARDAEIDVGNAGTLLRILPGWLAGQGHGQWVLDGDDSIRRRPVDRIAAPLRRMGAAVEARERRLPPLRVSGRELRGITYEMPVASAQVKSCLLLAGLLADGPTEIVEPAPSRDHTERMLVGAGAAVTSDGTRIAVEPAETIRPGSIAVPGDFSSAAFPLAAALIVPGSEVRLRRVGVNRTRTGLLEIARRMGAIVDLQEEGESAEGDEPTATIVAFHSALAATEVSGAEIPLAIDELPLVALLGCFAEGTTRVGDAAELRHKESDRIRDLVAGLRALGADAEERRDGFVVHGRGGLRGGSLEARGDHRLAMLGAIAGLASADGVEVHGMESAAVSYPRFERDLRALLGG